jgi:hypothetical protein
VRVSDGDVVIPVALGPGDADPRSPARVDAADHVAPLGPGDDDARSPVQGEAAAIVAPPAPGDGLDANEGFHVLPPPPAAGPGDIAVGPRRLTRIPKE